MLLLSTKLLGTFNKIHHSIESVRCVNTETEVAGRRLFSFFQHTCKLLVASQNYIIRQYKLKVDQADILLVPRGFIFYFF